MAINKVLVKRVFDIQASEGWSGVFRRASKKLIPPRSGPFPERTPGYLSLEERSEDFPDKEKLRKYQNRYRGKRCFIIGNGPSLNKVDITLLNDEYTFGVNGLFYKSKDSGFYPTFYMVEDSHVMRDNVDAINEYPVKEQKFFPLEYKELVTQKEKTSFFRMNRGFYEKQSPNYGIPRFSTDCAERMYCGQSVTIMNLQLAHYMGFEKVYLIGMDFSYTIPDSAIVHGCNITSTEDDPNHFHPEYFGKGKKWHDPQLERVLLNYKMAQFVFECSGRKIYNATAGGKLEVFERVDYNSLFKK